MSKQNVEAIGGVYERWSEGDFRAGFLEPWARITIEAEEIADAGDNVLVTVRQRGVGDVSGGRHRVALTSTCGLCRGDQVVRLETFRERGEALEAAGLAA